MALGPLLWPAVARVRARLAAPETAQRRALARILADVAPTPWGRACQLDPRMPLKAFAQLPATTDADLRPFVERILGGERRAISAAGAVAMARTAGTTGPPRLLPVTAALRADLLAFARRLLLGHLHASRHPLPQLARWLLVTASTRTEPVGGLPAGYVSGLVQDAVRRARPAFAHPDPDIAAIEEREARLDRLIAVTRGARVGTLFGVPADLVALLERLNALVGRPAGEVWPMLEEVYWIGSHLGPARARIERLVGRPLAFREVYGGAEGAFGADWRGEGGLALVPDRVVYAFEPVADDTPGRRPAGRRLLLHELVEAPLGARFELLVTTAAGLVHYRVGDVIEVTGHRPLTVAVAGRTGECLSLAGERLVPSEAQAALARLVAGRGLAVDDWLVAPAPAWKPGVLPRHRWVLEGPPPPAESGRRGWPALAARLDAALREVAPAYHRARAAGRLGCPELFVVPRGAFDRYRALTWPAAGPVKLRPFAGSWAEAVARPGLGPVLAALDCEVSPD